MTLEEAIEAVLDGEAVLFIGAGKNLRDVDTRRTFSPNPGKGFSIFQW